MGFAFTPEANIDFEMARIPARFFFRGPKRLMELISFQRLFCAL